MDPNKSVEREFEAPFEDQALAAFRLKTFRRFVLASAALLGGYSLVIESTADQRLREEHRAIYGTLSEPKFRIRTDLEWPEYPTLDTALAIEDISDLWEEFELAHATSLALRDKTAELEEYFALPAVVDYIKTRASQPDMEAPEGFAETVSELRKTFEKSLLPYEFETRAPTILVLIGTPENIPPERATLEERVRQAKECAYLEFNKLTGAKVPDQISVIGTPDPGASIVGVSSSYHDRIWVENSRPVEYVASTISHELGHKVALVDEEYGTPWFIEQLFSAEFHESRLVEETCAYLFEMAAALQCEDPVQKELRINSITSEAAFVASSLFSGRPSSLGTDWVHSNALICADAACKVFGNPGSAFNALSSSTSMDRQVLDQIVDYKKMYDRVMAELDNPPTWIHLPDENPIAIREDNCNKLYSLFLRLGEHPKISLGLEQR